MRWRKHWLDPGPNEEGQIWQRWNENPAAQYFWSRSSDTDPRYQRGIHSDTWYTLIHYINIETNKTDLLNFTAFINTFNADWFDVRVKGPIFLCTILFCFVHQRWHRRTFGISPQLNVSSTPPNIEHPPQFYGSKHVLCSPIKPDFGGVLNEQGKGLTIVL